MIYTNIYPPKKLSVKHFLSSPEKQDLSDFLSQWYLKKKQNTQLKQKRIDVFPTKELLICACLFKKKKKGGG